MLDRVLQEMAALWNACLENNRSEQRATKLLLENLTEDQAKSLISKNYFYIKGGATGKIYRISPAYRVVEYDSYGRAVAKLCFDAKGPIPIADGMLAQKVALEIDERHALSVANISRWRFPELDVRDQPSLFRRQNKLWSKLIEFGIFGYAEAVFILTLLACILVGNAMMIEMLLRRAMQ